MENLNNLEHNSYFDKTFSEMDCAEKAIEGKVFEQCHFISCNFSQSTFEKCKFNECTFKNCNLSNIKIPKSHFYDVSFEGSKLIGVNWTKANWPSIKVNCSLKFYQCILSDSSFMGLCLRELEMIECKAHDVDFREADCLEADFSFTDFSNSLFNRTELSKANFADSTNYNINVFHNNIKKAKFNLPEAVNLLHCLEIEIVD